MHPLNNKDIIIMTLSLKYLLAEDVGNSRRIPNTKAVCISGSHGCSVLMLSRKLILTMETSDSFEYQSFIIGYHIYQNVWEPNIGERLFVGNSHDKFAAKVISDGRTVGHMPKEISKVCHSFIKRGGKIVTVVTGRKVNRGLDLGLEIPAKFSFTSKVVT